MYVPGRANKPPSYRRPRRQLQPHRRSWLGLASRTFRRTRLHRGCERCTPAKTPWNKRRRSQLDRLRRIVKHVSTLCVCNQTGRRAQKSVCCPGGACTITRDRQRGPPPGAPTDVCSSWVRRITCARGRRDFSTTFFSLGQDHCTRHAHPFFSYLGTERARKWERWARERRKRTRVIHESSLWAKLRLPGVSRLLHRVTIASC